MKTKLTAETARDLASRLVLESSPYGPNPRPRIKAEIVTAPLQDTYGDVVKLTLVTHLKFTGGRFGEHTLMISRRDDGTGKELTFRTREEVVAHWVGYAMQNGYTKEEAEACVATPQVGDPVFCNARWTRRGRVVVVGPRRVTMEFRRINGSKGRLSFPIDSCTRMPGGTWRGIR